MHLILTIGENNSAFKFIIKIIIYSYLQNMIWNITTVDLHVKNKEVYYFKCTFISLLDKTISVKIVFISN